MKAQALAARDWRCRRGRCSRQHSSTKAAIFAVGTHVLFQLSSDDATKMATALGGGRQLSDLLRYLPHREIVMKSGHHRWTRVAVPEVRDAIGAAIVASIEGPDIKAAADKAQTAVTDIIKKTQ